MDASEQIKRFYNFLEKNYQSKILENIRKGKNFLVIDFSKLSTFDHELAEEILEQPEETIKAAEIAVEQFELPNPIKRFRVRVTKIPEDQTVAIRHIRAMHIGKLIVAKGIVRQSSDVRPQTVSAKFECPSCGNTISILQTGQKFKEPTRCSCGRKGKFRLLSKELVDSQRIVVEEAPEFLDGGEQPKRISVFLREDLVEPVMERKTTPGSKILIAGILKEIPINLREGGTSTRFDIVIEANYIEPIEETFETIDINEEDEKEIIKLSEDPKIYDKLVKSIAPSVYGHEDIKEALVLQLMGGVKKERNDGTITRGDMHILLVGDPGAAKSTLLIFMSHAAPKARYVAGRGASGAGLTASVVRDEFLRGWALEAGAMVLANGGYCMIDEMDKMSTEDRSALHEALSQQKISISKANIQATLRAETTVLAAANPKLGRFDPYQSIAQQIDLPPALINRFDLIFPVRDLPSRDVDEKIASHVLNIQQSMDIREPDISIPFLKKYVAYAKQTIKPKLTDGAIEEIKNFYVELRNMGTDEEGIRPIPISARQLEALVRLSEGSAKVRLSKKVTKSDAKRAIRILKYCLMQVGFDYETGRIDIDRISTGIPASQRSRIVQVREIINELESTFGKTIPLEDIISSASEKGIEEAEVEEIIERLKRSGDIFEPKRNFLSKL
jgi:replicative DNA helicase Mcm